MPPATADLILELVRATQTDLHEMRDRLEAHISDLYDIVKGNGRPGLRQTQDELAAMVRQCAEHRAQEAAARAAQARTRDTWLMFILRPLWPILIGLASAGVFVWIREGMAAMN